MKSAWCTATFWTHLRCFFRLLTGTSYTWAECSWSSAAILCNCRQLLRMLADQTSSNTSYLAVECFRNLILRCKWLKYSDKQTKRSSKLWTISETARSTTRCRRCFAAGTSVKTRSTSVRKSKYRRLEISSTCWKINWCQICKTTKNVYTQSRTYFAECATWDYSKSVILSLDSSNSPHQRFPSDYIP